MRVSFFYIIAFYSFEQYIPKQKESEQTIIRREYDAL